MQVSTSCKTPTVFVENMDLLSKSWLVDNCLEDWNNLGLNIFTLYVHVTHVTAECTNRGMARVFFEVLEND